MNPTPLILLLAQELRNAPAVPASLVPRPVRSHAAPVWRATATALAPQAVRWSSTAKGSAITIEDGGKAARNTGGDGHSVCSAAPVPSSGSHFYELTYSRPGTATGDSLYSFYMTGVLSAAAAQRTAAYSKVCGLAKMGDGFWGVDDDGEYSRSGTGLRTGRGGRASAPAAAKGAGGRVFPTALA